MEKIFILEDEKSHWENQFQQLQEEFKDAWKAIGEAAGINCDWHDNFAFDDAQRSFEVIWEKIKKVTEILGKAIVINERLEQEQVVAIGKKITILINGTEEQEFVIGGYQTPIKGYVSYNAPLVKPLIGKIIWDTEEVYINGQMKEIEILNIQ